MYGCPVIRTASAVSLVTSAPGPVAPPRGFVAHTLSPRCTDARPHAPVMHPEAPAPAPPCAAHGRHDAALAPAAARSSQAEGGRGVVPRVVVRPRHHAPPRPAVEVGVDLRGRARRRVERCSCVSGALRDGNRCLRDGSRFGFMLNYPLPGAYYVYVLVQWFAIL